MRVASLRCARSRCPRPAVRLKDDTVTMALCLPHRMKSKKSKMGNRREYSDMAARTFDSAWEREFCEGKLLEARAGKITGLEFQKTFKLEVNGLLVATYRADACWFELDGRYIVADSKGFVTPIYRLKRKLMNACLGITIQEFYKPRGMRGRGKR